MKILLLRNMSNQININNYNVQEIGLAKALAKRGHKCDVILFSNIKEYRKEIIRIDNEDRYITIHWVHGINVHKNAIYYKLIREKFFDQFDLIQTHEYNQIMTFILPFVTKTPKIIYHGPYQDIRNKVVQRLYDFILLPSIRKHYDHVIVKSNLSKDYLLKKGFRKVNTIGVGLDQNRFNNSLPLNKKLLEIYDNTGDCPVLVYIGTFCKWKNTSLLIDIVNELKKKIKFKLLIIGSGEGENKDGFFRKIQTMNLDNYIQYVESVNQREISNIYKSSDLLLLPSTYEIFGMVLLESLYFNCPVLTSYNGGSSVILKSTYPEMIMSDFDAKKWADQIIILLQNKNKYKFKEFIEANYTWDIISEAFENNYLKVIDSQNS